MKKFEILPDSFRIDGKKEPFLCGEIQYFRMPRAHWEAALDRLVESGCNAVAYYVPWFVHEYEEGKFDFTGKVHPDNDLHAWIRLTQEKGLFGFLRPGPYIYAETTDLGIPTWFSLKHPNAKAKCYKGRRLQRFQQGRRHGPQSSRFSEGRSAAGMRPWRKRSRATLRRRATSSWCSCAMRFQMTITTTATRESGHRQGRRNLSLLSAEQIWRAGGALPRLWEGFPLL